MREVFKIAGAKPIGRTCNAFLRSILRQHPELRGQTAYFPRQGNAAITVLINGRIYKAARVDGNLPGDDEQRENRIQFVRRSIEREYRILCHLKGEGLAVSEPGDWGHDPPYFDQAFKLGKKLDQDALDKMTEQERRQIAKDLAGFMADLPKKFSAEDAKKVGIENDAMEEIKPEDFKALLDDPAVAKALGNNLDFCRQMQREFARKYEEEYRDVPMVISHGDLKPDNVLYDPKTKRIKVGGEGAIIDFGACSYLRPAMNCVKSAGYYKDDFIGMICEEYSNQTGNRLSLRDVKAWECANLAFNVRYCLDLKNEKRLRVVLDRLTKLKESLVDMQDVKPRNPSEPSRKVKTPTGSLLSQG